MSAVMTGATRVAHDPGLLGQGRFGLVTNFTGVMPDLTRNVDAFLAAGLNVTALFGPEHGLRGSVQAGETEVDAVDPATGLPLFETYMATDAQLDALVKESGVDALVFDMQDIGVRYYTYVWTMFDCMRSAARNGIRFIVLDRPNPLGGDSTEGPGLDAEFASFVGRIDIPLRHGLTAGELAQHINNRILSVIEGLTLDLSVVTMDGWTRFRALDYSDGFLPDDDEAASQIADIIRAEKPEVIITHWTRSIHRDHVRAAVIAERGRFLASLPLDYPLPTNGVTQFLHADNWEDADGFDPDLYVPIPDEAFARWRAAIQNQAFARGETYGFRYIDYYEALMTVKGCLVGQPRACGSWSEEARSSS